MGKSLMNSHQPSLTEWLAAVGKKVDAEKLREEDNNRIDRFKFLNQTIGFPADLPIIFKATELLPPSESFKQLLKEKGQELACIRLVPTAPDLPKLRERGTTLNDCYNNWFLKQNIQADKYTAEVYQHIEPKAWATTFVVKDSAIFGEIISGPPEQLTHGETKNILYQFNFDYNNWVWSKDNNDAQDALQKMLACIKVQDKEKQQTIKQKTDANFYHDYLEGYYEAYIGANGKILFIDYNQMLVKYLDNNLIVKFLNKENNNLIVGAIAYRGKIKGKVRLVDIEKFNVADFADGDILVCDNTDVRYVPLMQKAGAIITSRGGILSHAAIIARELRKPCLIGAKNATILLSDGDTVEVDAEKGVVIKI